MESGLGPECADRFQLREAVPFVIMTCHMDDHVSHREIHQFMEGMSAKMCVVAYRTQHTMKNATSKEYDFKIEVYAECSWLKDEALRKFGKKVSGVLNLSPYVLVFSWETHIHRSVRDSRWDGLSYHGARWSESYVFEQVFEGGADDDDFVLTEYEKASEAYAEAFIPMGVGMTEAALNEIEEGTALNEGFVMDVHGAKALLREDWFVGMSKLELVDSEPIHHYYRNRAEGTWGDNDLWGTVLGSRAMWDQRMSDWQTEIAGELCECFHTDARAYCAFCADQTTVLGKIPYDERSRVDIVRFLQEDLKHDWDRYWYDYDWEYEEVYAMGVTHENDITGYMELIGFALGEMFRLRRNADCMWLEALEYPFGGDWQDWFEMNAGRDLPENWELRPVEDE